MALIPPFFPDCVVSLGVREKHGTRWAASGFLYRPAANPEALFVVTNRHVLEDQERLVVRFDPADGDDGAERGMEVTNAGAWACHPDPEVDVAVLPLSPEVGSEHAAFDGRAHAMPIAELRAHNVTEGDGVFVLGFPMGMIGPFGDGVIVRSGCIARVRDALAGRARTFLVDALVFPGNSGGPVILRPEAMAIEGTTTSPAAKLIGVVSSYLPYRDVAVSQQTKRPRVIFEENAGLAAVHPVDCVDDAIAAARASEPGS